MFRIVEKTELAAGIFRMRVEAPRVAASALPGQFVIVRADEQGERVPLTVADYDRTSGTVTIVTQTIGVSTRKICALEAGDALADFAGPLGHPSEFVTLSPEALRGRRYLFVAGGVGTAPVYPQVKWLHEHGVGADVIVGAKTRDMLIYTDEMRAVAGNLYIATDDGSEGYKGMVTGLIRELIDTRGKRYDECVAIGPMVMMKFVALDHARIRAENHRVAQRADGRRYGNVRRLPGDGGRQDLLHLRRRAGIRRSCRRFRRGDAPSGDVPASQAGARNGRSPPNARRDTGAASDSNK